MVNIVISQRITLVILTILVPKATALMCYQCITSINNTCPLKDMPHFKVDCDSNFNVIGTTGEVFQVDYDEKQNSGPLPSRIEVESNGTEIFNSPKNVTLLERDASYKYVCIKNLFYIKKWTIEVFEDVETYKRMIKPRISYSCGRVKRDGHQGDECISRNSRDISQTQCTCTTDFCNGSKKSISNFVTLIITVFLLSSISRII